MKERSCIILAAGRGLRLRIEKPKPLIEVYDKPIIHHLMQKIHSLNLDQIILVIGYKGELIKKYLRDPEIKYAYQSILNGNGGALIQGDRLLDNCKSVLVIQSDDSTFYSTDTLERLYHLRERSEADIVVLTTQDYDAGTHRSQFEVNNDRIVVNFTRGKIAKPELGNFFTGTCCFSRSFLSKYLSKLEVNMQGEVIIPDLFIMAMQDRRKVLATSTNSGEWLGINTPEELEKARYFASGRL